MSARIHQHAKERLTISAEMTSAKLLAACKTFIRLESKMIRMRHDGGESGSKVAEARSDMIDALLVQLFAHAISSYEKKNGKLPAPVSLLALGGYGRGELCPLSDIDIMFLFPSKVKLPTIQPLQQHLIDTILYILWDCNLKVGHSTRTIDDVFSEARKDIQTKTALLECRLITGDSALFDSFSDAYKKFYQTESPTAYLQARLDDQAARRAKFGNTVFLQEPDIKNGVGGLRDYQNALWMAKVKLGIDDFDQLIKLKLITASELREFRRSYRYLLRTRNQLHFQSKRPTDLLDLGAQPTVAKGLGYEQREVLARVEDFMHDYYKSAQSIYRISRLLEQRLSLSLAGEDKKKISFAEAVRARRYQKTKRIDGFILRGHELSAESSEVFKNDPVRMVRVFRHCQSLGAQLDFDLQSLIRESLPLVTRKVRHSEAACKSFRAILTEAGSVYPTLSLMHDLGVLGRFIPEFDELTCLVQHEYYHRYTADIHTLNAIRQLDFIYSEAEPITLKYRSALHESDDPLLLYLILLLHDIGKAKGIRGHAETGVVIAMPILERLGVGESQRETVAFIIKNHLIMAQFWQKRDIDDPACAAIFAEMVQSPENLRLLYVHTFCDARGTSAGLWNGYKDTLHTTLYRASLEHLTEEESLESRNARRLEMTYKELISKKTAGISQDEITAHFNLLPERYFIQTETEEIALHIRMVNQLLRSITKAESVGSLSPVIEWQDDLERSLTVVHVVTWDRAGLFYKLAGAFAVAGLSILTAKVISRNDHIAIDTFYVVEPGRGVVQSARAQEIFAKTVEQALVNNRDLYPEILAQAKRHQSSLYTTSSQNSLSATFPPSVEVYNELSMERTIVEIQAKDEIGLLFRIAKKISDHNFDITFSRIGTERGVAIDSFYIENSKSETPISTDKLKVLRDDLLTVIKPSDSIAAAS